MSVPLTILFQHHKTDALTRGRYDGLARRNPGVPIVPLTNGSDDVLPGTFDVAKVTDPGLPVESPWHGADMALYAWFRHGRTPATTADRYAVVEYDMLFTAPLADYYREVWDADLAAGEIHLPDLQSFVWDWFPRAVHSLPGPLRPYAAGAAPLAGTLLSHRALAAAAEGPIPPSVFCEVRLATLVMARGLTAAEFPYRKSRNLTWREDLVRKDLDTGAYHPLKSLCPLDDL